MSWPPLGSKGDGAVTQEGFWLSRKPVASDLKGREAGLLAPYGLPVPSQDPDSSTVTAHVGQNKVITQVTTQVRMLWGVKGCSLGSPGQTDPRVRWSPHLGALRVTRGWISRHSPPEPVPM